MGNSTSKQQLIREIVSNRKLAQQCHLPTYEKENLFLLHEAFTSLDPTMKVLLQEPRGDIIFSSSYNANTQLVTVHLHEVRNIRPNSIRAVTCDPFVKVFLLSLDNSSDTTSIIDTSVYCTKVSHKTTEVFFNDMIIFQAIKPESVASLRVVFELWDCAEVERFSQVIGVYEHPVGQTVYSQTSCLVPMIMSTPVHCLNCHVLQINKKAKGGLLARAKYDTDRSCLVVYKLRVAKSTIEEGKPVQCRVMFRDTLQETHPSPSKDFTIKWNDELLFPCQQSEVNTSSLLVTVFSKSSDGYREDFGQVILSLKEVTSDTETHFKKRLEDLTIYYERNRKLVENSSTFQEMKAAFLAHTQTCAPHLVFQDPMKRNQQGVHVTCRRAGSKQKTILFEGAFSTS